MITQPHPAFGWVLAVLATLVFALALAADKLAKPAYSRDDLKRATGFKEPAFAMEFAESSKGVADLYAACKPALISKGLDGDDRVVIPVYASLLPLVFALIFLCMPAWTPLPLRLAALTLSVCLVGAAASFDSRENQTIRDIIKKTTTTTAGEPFTALPREKIESVDLAQDLRDLRRSTNYKWALIFASFAVAGLMVLSRGGWWSAAAAATCLGFAALGLACVFASRHSLLEFTFNRLLPLPFLLIGLWLALPPRAGGDEAARKIAAARANRAAPKPFGKTS